MRAPVSGVVLNRNITLYQWFKAGEEFYSIADIRRLWVYADVYENEARYLRPTMTVRVAHSQMGKTFSAKVSEVLPLFDPVSKTLKVRLDVGNPRYDLRPDMFVDVEIPIAMPGSLNVPGDAVIDSGTKTIVYVDMGDGTFDARRVETGWRLGRQVEITGGLMPGEKVVVSGNFLIDSESRIKTAAYMVANCKLSPEADANLHVILAEIIAGSDLMKGKNKGKARKGAVKIIGALETYPQYFEHPGWQKVQ